MPASYKRINYNLRPAKSIERKMLCEAFKKLISFSDLSDYRYVGFGSPFFTDFALMHKSLGLTDLISIEIEEKDEKRFKFNRPYKCIRLYFGDSNDVLPAIAWNKKTILWLDYDYRLTSTMLTDVGTFIANAKPLSLLLLTMDVTPYELPNAKGDKARYDQFLKSVGKSKIPLGTSEKDLDQLAYPEVCYDVLNNEISEMLAKKNGGRKNKLVYKQLFNFIYQDGSAPMLTVGGLFHSEKDTDKVEKCNFESLEFLRTNAAEYSPYKIDVPNLTFREMRSLDRFLPCQKVSGLGHKGNMRFLPKEIIEKYNRVYRYFPNFIEAEMH